MQMDRMTTKSREALSAAMDFATRQGHPELLPIHLMLAILGQKDGGVGPAVINDISHTFSSGPRTGTCDRGLKLRDMQARG